MEKILKAEGLTRAFENKGERFLAVRDVSFSLYRGEAIGIVGESGSGKSTLVRMLTGLLAPTKGKIEFLSRDLTHAGGSAIGLCSWCFSFRRSPSIPEKRWEAELGRA